MSFDLFTLDCKTTCPAEFERMEAAWENHTALWTRHVDKDPGVTEDDLRASKAAAERAEAQARAAYAATKQTPANRVIDLVDFNARVAELDAMCARTLVTGQRLLARIRPSSKYYGQGDEGALFPVVITAPDDYQARGGPGGQYRLKDIDLFAVFEGAAEPIQITFEPPAA